MVSSVETGEVITAGAKRLSEAGIEDARREMRLILSHVTGRSLTHLMTYPEEPVDDVIAVEALIARRAGREPLSRILGYREFWKDRFTITPDTLDPRADTETLIEGVLVAWEGRSQPRNILDLGTGSGCILLSLLREFSDATGLGIDLSDGAVEAAAHNAEALGVSDRAEFRTGNWFHGLTGEFDLIVSNPPYIETDVIAGLEPEVRHFDPMLALDGGGDGLDPYPILTTMAPRFLRQGGMLVMEVGQGQAKRVSELAVGSGFGSVWTRHDLGGIERGVFCQKYPANSFNIQK